MSVVAASGLRKENEIMTPFLKLEITIDKNKFDVSLNNKKNENLEMTPYKTFSYRFI